MSDKKYACDWDRRIVDFSVIHGNSDEAYQYLIDSMQLQEGMHIADVMGGYGEASSHILEWCNRHNLTIDLTLLDSSNIQLGQSIENLKKFNTCSKSVTHILGDVRHKQFEDKSLDAIVIKMGLHEVPLHDQKKVLSLSSNALKDEGKLYLWETMGSTKECNHYFNKIVQKKDELAGFYQMAKNRHFPNEQKIRNMMESSGFSDVREVYCGEFYISPCYTTDLKENPAKIHAFNEYVRNLLTPETKKQIEFEDFGDSIQMKFLKKIFVGIKN